MLPAGFFLLLKLSFLRPKRYTEYDVVGNLKTFSTTTTTPINIFKLKFRQSNVYFHNVTSLIDKKHNLFSTTNVFKNLKLLNSTNIAV